MDNSFGEIEVAVLKEKVLTFEKFFERLDQAILKITEVNSNVSKMLAVHEERLGKQERVDEILFDKIDKLREQMDTDHNSLLQRLAALERKVWTGLGALGAVTLLLQLVGPQIFNKVLSPAKASGTMVEARPVALELHRREVHQPGLSTTE